MDFGGEVVEVSRDASLKGLLGMDELVNGFRERFDCGRRIHDQ
jgi:hypothetical protein